MISLIPPTPSCCEKKSCCAGKPKETNFSEQVLHVLEKVSLVALAALSLYTSWQLFIPFFLAGSALGLHTYFTDKNAEYTRISPSCTQGILEQVTGFRLPPAIALVSNVAITACHTMSHGMIFVPIVGFSVGAFAGKTLGQVGNWAYKEIQAYTAPQPAKA